MATHEHMESPIAIIGVSCRFAGDATDPEKLWKMLVEGRGAWSEIPSSRFNLDAWYHPDPSIASMTNVRGGHFLTEDVAKFDAAFFNFSSETASVRASVKEKKYGVTNSNKTLDPQIRLQLESVYEALENAGITLTQVAGSNTSVFTGAFFHDYQDSLMRDPETLPRFLLTGNGAAMASNRISHFYDLRGPSMTLDTGCSTSLVALHQACQSLKSGDADMAIVGGSNVILNPDVFINMSSLGFLSPDGKSYAFDSRANGYGRGEGVATIILKRLDDALKSNDPVQAVIRGTQLNQDGKTETITSPSQQAQEELIRSCYRRCGADTRNTQYFEAHGTGTPTGDPIEARAIASVFQEGRSSQEPLLIGSVKTNLGHTEPTSGLASIIKVTLAMEKGLIPPSINFEKANKQLSLEEWNLKVPTSCKEWKSGPDGIRRASVNNFGYGGTNAHVIIESWPHQHPGTGSHVNGNGHTSQVPQINGTQHTTNLSSRVFILSGQNKQSCEAMAANLKQYLQDKAPQNEDSFLANLAYTLGQRRTRFAWVLAITATTVSGLIKALDSPNLKPERAANKPRLGFIFTGQGAQWYAMGRELIHAYPAFKSSILEGDEYLREFGCEWSLLEELLRNQDTSRVSETLMSTPLCVALQIALFRLLELWNVTPIAVSSHSSGEITAAYAAGALSYKDAIAVSYCRGQITSAIATGMGAMLALGLGKDGAQELFKYVTRGQVKVACINSPSSVTISGDTAAIEELEGLAKARNLFARRLRVNAPFHSYMMEPLAQPYIKQMRSKGVGQTLQKMKPLIYASPTTGTRITDATEISTPEHWARSMSHPVLFLDAFREMALDMSTGKLLVDTVIEIGPHSALAGPIGDILLLPEFHNNSVSYLSCLIRNKSALDTMHSLASQLICNGLPVNLAAINAPHGKVGGQVLHDLPPYSWNHQTSLWHEPRINRTHRNKRGTYHDLLGSPIAAGNSITPTWRHVIRASELPWVRDHCVQSSMVYPGAGYICMAIEAAYSLSQTTDCTISGYQLRDIDIQQALMIPPEDGVEVQIMLSPVSDKAIGLKGYNKFRVSSVSLDNKWTEHCSGLILVEFHGGNNHQDQRPSFASRFDTKPLQGQVKSIQPEDVFSGMRSVGISHGPLFKNLKNIQAGVGESVTTMSVANSVSKMPANHQARHVMHPTTLDSVFIAAYTALGEVDIARNAKVPRKVKELWVSHDISSQVGHEFIAYSKVDQADTQSFKSNVFLVNASQDDQASRSAVLVVNGLFCQSLGTAPRVFDPYKNELYSFTKWSLDISSIEPGVLKRKLGNAVDEEEVQMIVNLKHACLHFMRQALQSLSASDIQLLSLHHGKVYMWMKLVLGNAVSEVSQLPGEGTEGMISLLDSVSTASVNGELVCHLGPKIASILRGETSALELMMEGHLLYKYYQDYLKSDRSNRQLAQLVRHIVYRNPRVKILEIGAGTGGTTRHVLNVLLNETEHGSQSFISEYHFTDISSGFFENAQETFSPWERILTYHKLDIEVDPDTQGFECGSYDLIIASQCLHATRRMENTMANVRSLLKPGGRLLLLETTKDQIDIQLAFGLLPGWWLGEEKNRSLSPNLTVPQWDQVLKATGFSGVDLELRDCESDEFYSLSVILSTAQSDTRQPPRFDPIVLVTGSASVDEDWLKRLQRSIAAATGGTVPAVESFDSVDAQGKLCVLLAETQHPLLSKPSEAEFRAVKALALDCNGLLWVSRGGAVDCESPFLALSPGFLRSLRIEYTEKTYISLDLDPRRDRLGQDDIAAITKVLVARFDHSVAEPNTAQDYEFAEREGELLIPRVLKDVSRNSAFVAGVENGTPRLEPFEQPDRPLKLKIDTPGLMETLVFNDHAELREDLNPEDIQVKPVTFGVNFRDVMVAMGQLSETRMGYECAGIITRVGTKAKAHGYNIGDEVFCLLNGQYGSQVRLPWSSAYPKPADLSFEIAASIPLVFATAHISLYGTARLCKSESILIHAATGGVGQAAIILSQLIGAEIFATAGTKEKRDFLVQNYGIPEDHIFSSRDTSFVGKLVAKTGSRGVDVVLNSLSGKLLQESFNCLAPFGRFVEIGRFDLEQNNSLEMGTFARSVSFSSVDLGMLMKHAPRMIHQALKSVATLLEQKLIRAVDPISVFPLEEIEQAFRQMQAGKHMGKIVLSVGAKATVPVHLPRSSAKFRPDSSYLIIGGIGGIGQSVARWMLSHGAKNLILMSRGATTDDKARAFVAALQEEWPKSKLVVIACDITNACDLSSALQDCAKKLPPIRGVIQGAMVLQDAILEQMTVDKYNAAVGPKVQGTWNLHQQLPSDIDFFIMLSSIAGVLGYTSQSNYTAGGAFEDALARYRVANGLPAVAVDLGVVKSIGYVAEHRSVQERLSRIGHTALSEDQVLAAIESAILSPSPQVIVGINTGPGPHWDNGESPLRKDSRLSGLQYLQMSKNEGSASPGYGKADKLAYELSAASSTEQAAGLVLEELTKKVGKIFGTSEDSIDISKPLAAFGVDSLVAVELRNMLALQAGAQVSIFDVMQSPSLMALSHSVALASTYREIGQL